MGLLDKVLGKADETLDAREGFAGIAFCAVAADGTITEDEATGLAAALGRMEMFQGVGTRRMNVTFEKLARLVRDKGADEVVARAAAVVPVDLRATAFAVAADLMMADRHVAEAEKQLLAHMQRSLDVPEAEAMRIVEVLVVKNKG